MAFDHPAVNALIDALSDWDEEDQVRTSYEQAEQVIANLSRQGWALRTYDELRELAEARDRRS